VIISAIARMIHGARGVVDHAPTAAPAALDLRDSWHALLQRRPALAGALGVYGRILEHWATSSLRVEPLAWDAAACQARWIRGVPLVADLSLPVTAEAIEPGLGTAMETVATVRPADGPALQRLADAWDRGTLEPRSLVPSHGGWSHAPESIGVSEDVLGFLAVATLRPALERFFAPCRANLDPEVWRLGLCPFCGAPPGFADVTPAGGRRLACHLCGGAWTGPRLWCPFCANESTADLRRLEPERTEQGYFVSACTRCGGYLKELDRRVRWNGEHVLLEDWSSPHLDLVAIRAGYRRPLPTLLGLALPGASAS
jgi:FdhE protein